MSMQKRGVEFRHRHNTLKIGRKVLMLGYICLYQIQRKAEKKNISATLIVLNNMKMNKTLFK